MKEPMQNYMLTKDEIASIRAISALRELSVGELAKKLHSSKGWASRVIKSLENKGLVQIRREGMKKRAEIAPTNYAQLLSDLVKGEPYVPWEKVLSYSNMNLLLANAAGEKDFERGVSNVTKWRALRNLSMHGLISPNQARSTSTALNLRINRFATEYADHITREFAQKFLPSNALILWQKGYSYLFKLRKSEKKAEAKLPKHFLKTALSIYPDHGIKFVTNDDYYYYETGKTKLSLEDAVLHTLLIDPGSQTHVIYALLLIFKERTKIDFKLLMKRSERYGLRKNIEDIVGYIQSSGKEQVWPLPRWEELEQQASVYGIRIL